VQAQVTAVHDAGKGHYGVAFAGFQSGGARDILELMNHFFSSRTATDP
jgi:hypothetical protein